MTAQNVTVSVPPAGLLIGAYAPQVWVKHTIPTASPPATPVARARSLTAPRSRSHRRPARRARSPARLEDDEPSADDLLAVVRPGHAAIINLTAEQRSVLLRDDEGRTAVRLLAHLLWAYAQFGWWRAFPFTEAFVLRLAIRSGLALGRNAARRAIRRLADTGVLVPAGFYREEYKIREPSGHRGQLWSVGPVVWIDRRPRRFAGYETPRSAPCSACVATKAFVKSRPWWKHPLLGDLDGLPPTRPPQVLERWKSPEHHHEEAAREAALEREPWVGDR